MDRRTFLERAGMVAPGRPPWAWVPAPRSRGCSDRLDRPWDDARPSRHRGARGSPWSGRASYDADLETDRAGRARAVGADVAGRTVVLKPNLVEYDPGAAINTDPRLIAATVLAMRRLGAAEVIVAEGPGPPARHPVRRPELGAGRVPATRWTRRSSI